MPHNNSVGKQTALSVMVQLLVLLFAEVKEEGKEEDTPV